MLELLVVGAIVVSINLTDGPRTKNSNYQDASLSSPAISSIDIPAEKMDKVIFRLATAEISESTKGISFFDMVDSATFCAPTSEWICFGAGGFKFSIPKKIVINRWTRDGAQYEIQGKTQLRLLGAKIDAYVIRGRMRIPREEVNGEIFLEVVKEWVFYFSDTHGLVAFETLLPDNNRGLYITMQSCGYAGLKAACAQD